mgnify:CR=1 FL=1
MNRLEKQVGALGIRPGTALFVHSSIKAVGRQVRAEALIEALRVTIGPDGTLLFPTFTDRQEAYFDPVRTPSTMGTVAEVFRKMPDTLRSRHPRHPVAAQGPASIALLEGHEEAVGPCGEGTPFERHARCGGQVLLIGVDLDTLTLLHTAEALLDLPYLNQIEGRCLEADGKIRTLNMRQAPGGHRGGVRSFEKMLRNQGLIRYGRIGNARTMLIDAGPALGAMVEILREDPAAALCRGPCCPDCVNFKGKIRARQLAELGAEISVILPAMPDNPEAFAEMLVRFGCPARFETIDTMPLVRLAEGEAPPTPPVDGRAWILQPGPDDLIHMEAVPEGYAGLAYAPLEAARVGLQPFYEVMYKKRCRDLVTDIFVADGVARLGGFSSPALGYLDNLLPDGKVALGEGHAQLREMVSALRMRSFTGRYHLVISDGNPYVETLQMLQEFWDLLP